ncbi:uncharacterized protein SAPINGB_P000623 [Magnusiomyces paraingens]|uniref:Uncharacterized protein n=1 Tax=Magnusiomyces paraingens TaxID=2606893 RepID=A0A5E8B1C5_9ASCO|nr:uncharacterized protein SAPINGB_P000623 [Saprochaete ingens]VVT45057.1 unnamed protein product [Saprochaete ingens]
MARRFSIFVTKLQTKSRSSQQSIASEARLDTLSREAHEGIAQFLSSRDCFAVSCTSATLRYFYGPLTYRACIVVLPDKLWALKQYLDDFCEPRAVGHGYMALVPLNVLRKPARYSWFHSTAVSEIYFWFEREWSMRSMKFVYSELVESFFPESTFYPLLKKISFSGGISSLPKIFHSKFYLSLKCMCHKNVLEALFRIHEPRDLLFYGHHIKHIDIRSDQDFSYLAEQAIAPLPYLESLKVSKYDCVASLLVLLSFASKSHRLKKVELSIRNENDEWLLIFTTGLNQLPPDIKYCCITLTSSIGTLPTPFNPSLIIPQVTALVLPDSQGVFTTGLSFPRLSFLSTEVGFTEQPLGFTSIAGSLAVLRLPKIEYSTASYQLLQLLPKLRLRVFEIEEYNKSILMVNEKAQEMFSKVVSRHASSSRPYSPQGLADLCDIFKPRANLEWVQQAFGITSEYFVTRFTDPLKLYAELLEATGGGTLNCKEHMEPLYNFVFSSCFFEALFQVLPNVHTLQYFSFTFPNTYFYASLSLYKYLVNPPHAVRQVLLYFQDINAQVHGTESISARNARAFKDREGVYSSPFFGVLPNNENVGKNGARNYWCYQKRGVPRDIGDKESLDLQYKWSHTFLYDYVRARDQPVPGAVDLNAIVLGNRDKRGWTDGSFDGWI